MLPVLLLIELLDEFVFGAREAAWPLIRADLNLNYTDIGLLLGVPTLLGALIEPAIGILGDVWRRRLLILGGGVIFVLALVLTSVAPGFAVLLVAFVMFSPASGAFVGLSQAALMDAQPARREHNMARWTLAGAIGVLGGSLLPAASAAGGPGWRGLFFASAILATVILAVTARFDSRRFGLSRAPDQAERPTVRQIAHDLTRYLRRVDILRWLLLLVLADLMLDVLLGFIALYFVDVANANEAQAALAVTVWTGASLLGDLFVIPLLERVNGLRYVAVSAGIEMALFAIFLIVPNLTAKFALLGLVGLFSSGWYPVLKAQLYSVMPGHSGTAMALSSASAPLDALIPIVLGFVASRFGLGTAMWLLLLGPLALLVAVRPSAQGNQPIS